MKYSTKINVQRTYKDKIAIIGLGYVGLPLAIEFGKRFDTVGYDNNLKRINELKKNYDKTNEVSKKDFEKAKKLKLSNNATEISNSNIFIVTVPTPKNSKSKPDLRFLIQASKLIGKYLNPENIVIYESTVYPGVTENICAPILSKISGLKFLNDKVEPSSQDKKNGFYCGYSPERINPGDKKNHFTSIIKITSGSTPTIANKINNLYKTIVKNGTYKTSTIKIAEAAKVTENIQRDINIALINELSIIFNRLNIDTKSVLDAAKTKWNFLPFEPGLVGGHCIGIDPYYLIHRSKEVGYHPYFIESARKLNNDMGHYVAKQVIKLLRKKNIKFKRPKVLIMGLSYKENSSDIRDSLVFDIIKTLQQKGCRVEVHDPIVFKNSNYKNIEINPIVKPKKHYYDCVIIAVKHDKFIKMGINKIREFVKEKSVIYDVKNIFPLSEADGRL